MKEGQLVSDLLLDELEGDPRVLAALSDEELRSLQRTVSRATEPEVEDPKETAGRFALEDMRRMGLA